jgi:hypothetical protein|tara:strand:+ start:37 stop:240 length:204 start_codon:yes stop_codon:yes gene_type:complete
MPKDKKSMFQKAKDYGSGVPYKLGSGALTGTTIFELGKHLLGLKDGGRVKGCGIAKRGFGKAMKRKK